MAELARQMHAGLAEALAGIAQVAGDRLSTSGAVRQQHGKDLTWHPGASPDAVVYIHTQAEVQAIVRICSRHGVPIIPYGAGTSLEGHITAPQGGVTLDFSQMNAVLTVNADDHGTVKDVVVDSDTWKVSFIEVDTGWLFGRDVLIPSEKIARSELPGGGVWLALTKKAIESSPAADTARPAQHHYELLFPYYGLASPWGMPVELGMPPREDERPVSDAQRPRLVFARDLDGYELRAQGDPAGTVRDVLVDLESRKVTSILADMGGLLMADVAEIRLGPVVRIDTAERIVHVDVAKEVIEPNERLSTGDLPYVLPYVPPMA
jgi:uncharacterized protein YrrD